MSVESLISTARKSIQTNAPHLATGAAIVGVVATSTLAAKATLRATRILEQNTETSSQTPSDLEKLRLVAPVYIPTVVAGSATIASIIYLNNIGLKRTAAATALYAVSERAFDDYKEKMIEKFGYREHVAVQDEIAQDQVTKNPPVDKEVVFTGNGDVMCYDSITGRYFRSTAEKLRRSEIELNKQILDEMYATLSDFYYLIGLQPTDYSDEVGWNTDKMIHLNFSTTMAEDDTPCISILYNVLPTPEYIR